MPSPSAAKNAAPAREKMFLALIVTLAVAQLVAFWMLCSHQVREAQARGATVQVGRSAGQHGHDANALLAAGKNTAHIGASAGQPIPVNFTLR